MSFKAALVYGNTSDLQGKNRQGSAKKSLDFGDHMAGSKSWKYKFWQQKAKGKQVDSRQGKHQGKYASKLTSKDYRQRQDGPLKIGSSGTNPLLVVPANDGPVGIENLQEKDDNHLHLSEYESKIIEAYSNGITADQDPQENVLEFVAPETMENMDTNNGLGDVDGSALPTVPEGHKLNLSILDSIGEEGELLGFEDLEDGCSNVMMDASILMVEDNSDLQATKENAGASEKKNQGSLMKKSLTRNGNMLPGVSSRKILAHILAFVVRNGDGPIPKTDIGKKV